MAKRARAPAALMALVLAPTVHAEVRFTPSINASETYSDNVSQATADRAESSFISELTPSFTVAENGPRLKLNGAYQLHLYSYSNKVDNTNNASSQYNLNMQAKLIDQLLDLDATASRQTVSQSAFGPQGNDSLYSNSNRTDVSTYSISPTLRHRFGGTADAYLRYTRNRVSGDNTALGNSNGDNISANITSGENFTTVGWGFNAVQDKYTDQMFGNAETQNAEANVRYRLGQTISLTATAGYDKYDYQTTSDQATQGKSWTGGFIWTPSSRTRLQMAYGRRYYGNTGNMAFTFRSHRSAVNASYTDTVTTSRQNFLSNTQVSTTSLLDAALTASIPDPVARAKAIADYVAATGVNVGVANNTNYLSNMFQRQKSLQVGYTLESPHATSTVTVYKTRSAALSTQQADSDVFGQSLALLNNNLDSVGTNVSYTQRLRQSTQLIGSLNYQRSRTLDTDLKTDTESARLGLTHSFDAKLRGIAEIRHNRGSYYNAGNARFRENAISATIMMQF
jgi:uncharacterized protein (PEP-CTERM system associated)